MAERLYHFTCRDGYRLIGRYNCVLRPGMRGWPVLWLTDEAEPDFDGCGLGNPVILGCDRREFRYVVTDTDTCRPWLGSPERTREPAEFLASLEIPEVARPERWWISAVPVAAQYDPSWRLTEATMPP